jgi:hypothetical protein
MQKYLYLPTLDNEQTHRIFNKPIVKQAMHFLGIMYLYQKRRELSAGFIYSLNKNAAPTLIEETEGCYRSVVRKTKDFYLTESKNLQVEVAWRRIEAFLLTLCPQVGLEYEGPMPFTKDAINWDVDHEEAEV